MCHRRGDRSRASSRASDSEDEREREEAVGWGVRAKERVVSFLSAGEDADETPERPTVEGDPKPTTTEPDPETSTAEPTEDDATDDAEDEREEEPIPADD